MPERVKPEGPFEGDGVVAAPASDGTREQFFGGGVRPSLVDLRERVTTHLDEGLGCYKFKQPNGPWVLVSPVDNQWDEQTYVEVLSHRGGTAHGLRIQGALAYASDNETIFRRRCGYYFTPEMITEAVRDALRERRAEHELWVLRRRRGQE